MKLLELNDISRYLHSFDNCFLIFFSSPGILKFMDRQLARYLKGDLANVTQDILDRCRVASPHNIFAERVLGLPENYWRRGEQTAIAFLESRIMQKINKTLECLNHLRREQQEDLFNFVIPLGAKLRKHNKERRQTDPAEETTETFCSWTEARVHQERDLPRLRERRLQHHHQPSFVQGFIRGNQEHPREDCDRRQYQAAKSCSHMGGGR